MSCRMLWKFLFILLLVLPNSCSTSSVTLSYEPYCIPDGSSNTPVYVQPDTTVSLTCAVVDNPDGFSNSLTWHITSPDVFVTNINGANADQSGFSSTINSFDNTEGTANATLTFTAVTALDEAVVSCRGTPLMPIDNCTLYIKTVPSPPLNTRCNTTYNSLTLFWDPPSDNGTGIETDVAYRVTWQISGDMTSYTNSTGGMTSLIIPNLQSSTQYNISISANNTVGYSNDSTTVCSTLDSEVFPAVPFEVCLKTNETSDYIVVNISQPCPPPNPNILTTPDFTNFTITISGYDPITTTSCQYEQPISVEMDYNITITVNNEVGPSEPTTVLFDARLFRDVDIANAILTYSVPQCILFPENAEAIFNITCNGTNTEFRGKYNTAINVSGIDYNEEDCNYNPSIEFVSTTVTTATILPSTTTTSSTTSTESSSTIPGATPSNTNTKEPVNNNNNTIAIVAGVIGGVVFILVIVIVVIVGIILYKKCSSEKSDGGKRSDPIPLVQKNIPETGQPALYQDPSTIEREKAPTGELYALPEKGSKQRRPPPAGPKNELPTYQDPNTIQRQVAPSGDMYALPEKNKHHAVGGMYAELDHMGPTSPTQQPLLHETQPHQPVVYSAVRHN